MRSPAQQTGMTLVEVLLASALAGFALLALALLHSQSLRAMEQAQRNIEANFLLQDLASRMQANPAGRSSYATYLSGTPNSQGCSSSSDSDPATACSASELAEHDAWMWMALVEQSLGDAATATLTTLNNDQTSYALELTWPESGESLSATYNFRLRSWIP
ncbi:MAG: hypothetical protein ACO376_01130 [Gammaproteobacteria bacterium]